MAERHEPSEADKLLAEVDSMLNPTVPKGPLVPKRSAATPPPAERSGGALVTRVQAAAVAGAVAGAGVWVLFALLPFLRATSGGVGAALAAFVATLLFRRRR